jgi:mono/diheme cytochrome c family protein
MTRHSLALVSISLWLAACGDDALPPPPPASSTGGALASSLACASCHGADLSGSESALAPGVYAPNLTPDQATGLGAWSDDDVATAIRTGVDDDGVTLCTNMPRFSTLSDDQTNALVGYLRSLAAITHAIPESDCTPDDLDDAGLDDAGFVIITDDAPSCDGYADPDTLASCHACSSGETCQRNGCFGGYFCDLSALHCVPKPDGC